MTSALYVIKQSVDSVLLSTESGHFDISTNTEFN